MQDPKQRFEYCDIADTYRIPYIDILVTFRIGDLRAWFLQQEALE